ncbi:hypothetical protein TorRG33x02_356260, partial [Trema orientale]
SLHVKAGSYGFSSNKIEQGGTEANTEDRKASLGSMATGDENNEVADRAEREQDGDGATSLMATGSERDSARKGYRRCKEGVPAVQGKEGEVKISGFVS